MRIRTNPAHFANVDVQLSLLQATADDQAIVHDLGHVAFMAWLAEARDQDDARYMRLLAMTRDTLDRSALHAVILQEV